MSTATPSVSSAASVVTPAHAHVGARRPAEQRTHVADAVRMAVKIEHCMTRLDDGIIESCDVRFVGVGDHVAHGRIPPELTRTACWVWLEPPKHPQARHVIMIGDQFAATLRSSLRSDEDAAVELAVALYRHETGHARFTPRNADARHATCRRYGIDARLANIAEDLRIEERLRRIHGRAFRWSTLWDDPVIASPSPHALLYAAVHFEGRHDELLACLQAQGVPTDAITALETHTPPIRDAVTYEDAMAATHQFVQALAGTSSASDPGSDASSGSPALTGSETRTDPMSEGAAPPMAVPPTPPMSKPSSASRIKDAMTAHEDQLPSLDEFAALVADVLNGNAPPSALLPPTFSETTPAASAAGPADLDRTDLALGEAIAADASILQAIMSASVGLEVRSADMCDEPEPLGGSPAPMVGTPLVTMHRQPYSMNRERILACAQRLERALDGPERRTLSRRPSPRVDVMRVIAGSSRVYQRQAPGRGHGIPSCLLMIDCSGSMDGSPAHYGRHLVAIFSELAQRGRLSGHVTLSQIDRAGDHRCQTLRLPMPLDLIARIPSDGSAEGIQASMHTVDRLVRDADVTALYSDCMLTDDALDLAAFRRRGIFMHGLYVGPPNRVKTMLRYTEHPIAAPDLETLIDRFVVHLLHATSTSG